MKFEAIAQQARTDPVLAELSETQMEGVVNLLTLMVYADQEVYNVEETEFEHLVAQLPWSEEHAETKAAVTQRALERVVRLNDEGALRAMIRDVAVQLGAKVVRERVFRMAAMLAWADMDLQPEESQMLGWIAASFGIDQDRARAIVTDVLAD